MMGFDALFQNILLGCMILLGVLIVLCIIRAAMGPRYTDRIVAANMVTTLSTILICILAYYLDESFLLDVAIIYALVGFLAVVVITRVATYRHYGTLMHKEDMTDAD